ncbi:MULTISPECIES: protein DpdH [unclassified Microcoleus]|uniref:protein DpdH n=1 Tax=unclassified Microcoleus TaxID=2642155 RepID=UPI002FD4B378
MTFTKFVCWDVDRVRRVMGVEATQTPDSIFLATHHPIAMYRQELIDAPSRVPYSEEQFLKDFLAEKDFAFVPVLGSSGTGKSHLIRWLAANIESTQKRRVLLIPKIGTNLKDILSLILEGMAGATFDEYRQRLNRATSTLTEAQAREQLLNQLAAAVGPNGRGDRTKLSDVEDYLVGAVDSFLYDPFFRKEYWLKDGGIIHQLVIHILGQRDTVEVVEERRHFSLNDLPLNVLNLQKAGQSAREFYSLLIGDEDIQRATVDWLNRHLDEAIAQVLSLGREDLQRLMGEVRETLAQQGIELVLLIEDFAKLQGIDREVLEAVLARPQQAGGKHLCAIRTALACTTGYFDSLRLDTVKQRITFSVNLDLGTVGEQSLVNYADIKQFVGRYLNAVRLEDKTIQNWWADSRNREGADRESLPSACNECEHKLACHAGFSEADGFGLYPFTPEGLEQMLYRVNPGNFNPRILIKDVLKWTLENSAADIEGGEFPAISVREHFGKMRLSAIVQGDIQAKDPENCNRRQILLDLWTDSNELCDLHPEVHSAFDIPALGVKVQPTKKSSSISGAKESRSSVSKYQVESQSHTKKNLTAAGQVPDKLTRQKEILDRWNNQEFLPQDIAGELRPLIYSAIGERLEWDTEMLLKGVFASSGTTYFKSRNITFFSPKVTRETISGVKLSLPLNPDDADEFRETAIAFQGMLQYSHYKHWKFPDGARYFRTYAKQLERWSQYVVEQIRLYPRESGEPWNPVPAAVELLAIAATMAGHPTNSIEDLINSLFLDLEAKDLETRSASWKKLFNSLQNHREALLEIVKSRTACTKGSSKQFQIIDVVQILDPLKQVSKSWQPQSKIPPDVREKFPEINKARQAADELLEKAIQEECDRQLAVYNFLVAELGEDIKKKDVTDLVKRAIGRSTQAGVFRGRKSVDDLTSVLEQFKRVGLSSYLETMKRVQTEKNNPDSKPGKLLKYLSENHQKAMTEASEFVGSTNNFLEASITEVNNQIEVLEVSGGATVESCHRAIQDGLAKLRNLITDIKDR